MFISESLVFGGGFWMCLSEIRSVLPLRTGSVLFIYCLLGTVHLSERLIRVWAPKAIAKALVGWIVQIQPHEPPVQSNVYRDLKKDLEHIEQAGVAVGWTSLPDTQDLRLPTMDLLEAVRLYGSAKEGFGTFPDQISKLLMATGLV
ncbi:hypothetical protein E8E14_004493 [Neopestalotiopsis sp. 37M]|nr:hypothetical protein E8E14_004493 [Neopestalotiopsis sp. 37M]